MKKMALCCAIVLAGCAAYQAPVTPTIVINTPRSIVIEANASTPQQTMADLAQAECAKRQSDAAFRGTWNNSAMKRSWVFYCVERARR